VQRAPAYYGLLHDVTIEVTLLLVPVGTDRVHWDLGRHISHISHTSIRAVCDWVLQTTPPLTRSRKCSR
jgi:hypothetical protein